MDRSTSVLYGCDDTVDPLGFLDLVEGEECLHIVRGSFSLSFRHCKNGDDGHTLVVGSRGLYLWGNSGSGEWRIRVPYENVLRWHVQKSARGQVKGVVEFHGHWKVDSDGRVPDVQDQHYGTIGVHVDWKERRKYQGPDSWYSAVERLVMAHRGHGGADGSIVEDVIQGFAKASRLCSSPIGRKQEVQRFECSEIIPFCEILGECVVSDVGALCFTPYCSDVLGKIHIGPDTIISIQRKPYILLDDTRSCEIYYKNGESEVIQSIFLVFVNAEAVDTILARVGRGPSLPIQDLKTVQKMWRMDQMSNFEYILYLNSCAGRSFKNIYRYPMFPWVLSDYSSSTLNLDNPNVYRDLTKPVATLHHERIVHSIEIFHALRDSGVEHPWMHGSHYSNPGVVVFFKVRRNPKLMLRLQGRKFDQPNRMFHSVMSTWDSVCSASSNDVKELIPEMYDPVLGPKLLENSLGVCLGTRSDGISIGDVLLPPWSSSVADFVSTMNMALESDYVSRHINAWIDLIFGINSRGAHAEKHHNVFHYMTYDEMYVIVMCILSGDVDCIDIDVYLCRAVKEIKAHENDRDRKHALYLEAREYGRTPPMIFDKEHPRKHKRNPCMSWICVATDVVDGLHHPHVYL